jgi:hypothetical protein
MEIRNVATVLVAGDALALSLTAGAFAVSIITGAQIQNGTIKSVDVKNETLKVKISLPRRARPSGARPARRV